jgi:microsomal dipeptidase-like Zn-dependent dipeptidase
LLVGSALFRDSFLKGGRGHVDLPRARDVGYGVVGLTVATTWPDVSGSLSRWHFRSLGMPPSVMGSRMAIANWLIDRIERWCADSDDKLVIIRSVGDLDRCLAPDGSVGVLIGVQGAHVLDGNLANVERLSKRGVRMFAPAHVMDNDAVGSGTGRTAGGLSGFGRELIAEIEAQGVIVDLAHMSVSGVTQTLPLLTRSFVLSHAAIREDRARPARLRGYSQATRNVPPEIAREVGARGGLFGIVLATQLLGGSSLNSAARTIRRLLELAGDDHVAIGSDMDGALKMLIDCEGLPALADTMLAAGFSETSIVAILGGNAARFLRSALPS